MINYSLKLESLFIENSLMLWPSHPQQIKYYWSFLLALGKNKLVKKAFYLYITRAWNYKVLSKYLFLLLHTLRALFYCFITCTLISPWFSQKCLDELNLYYDRYVIWYSVINRYLILTCFPLGECGGLAHQAALWLPSTGRQGEKIRWKNSWVR